MNQIWFYGINYKKKKNIIWKEKRVKGKIMKKEKKGKQQKKKKI